MTVTGETGAGATSPPGGAAAARDRPLVLVFEGQGARTIPAVHRHVIARLVAGVVLDDEPLDVVGLTPSVVQQVIVAHQVGQAAAFAAEGSVAGVIGQSLGEVAAFVAAGALSPDDAMTIVRLRAEVPASVLDEREWAMFSLTRVSVARAEEAASELGGWVVAYNGPVDTVVVLEADRLGAFLERVDANATRFRRLPVRYPYHTPVMAPVAEALADALAALDIVAPSTRVVSPTGPSEPATAEDVRRTILAALTVPVKWSTALSYAAERWPDARWRECGPSNALHRFVWKNRLGLDWEAAA